MSKVTYILEIRDSHNPELNTDVSAILEVEKRNIVTDVMVLSKMSEALVEENKRKVESGQYLAEAVQKAINDR